MKRKNNNNVLISNLLIMTVMLAAPAIVFAATSSGSSNSLFGPTSANTPTAVGPAAPVMPSSSVSANPQEMEKCYGIVKAGRSDCDTNNGPGSCIQPVIDSDPNYWVYVPKGTCSKIVGSIPEANSSTPASKNQYLESTDADMREDFKKGPDMGIDSADDLSTDNEMDPDVTDINIDGATN